MHFLLDPNADESRPLEVHVQDELSGCCPSVRIGHDSMPDLVNLTGASKITAEELQMNLEIVRRRAGESITSAT
jgi:hypothetical protein